MGSIAPVLRMALLSISIDLKKCEKFEGVTKTVSAGTEIQKFMSLRAPFFKD